MPLYYIKVWETSARRWENSVSNRVHNPYTDLNRAYHDRQEVFRVHGNHYCVVEHTDDRYQSPAPETPT